MHWLSWLAHLGAAQGFILALAIITVPYGNRQANRILAIFLCAESLRLLSLSYYYLEVNMLPGVPIYQLHHLSYAFGPLLYLYVHSLVDKDFIFHVKYLWHFTPVVIAIIVFMPGLFVSDEFSLYESYGALPWELKSKISLVSLPVFVSLGVYSVLALRHLQRHKMNIRREFSSLESVSLKWLKWLLWLCLFSAISAGAIELLQALMLVELGSRVVVSEITSIAIIYYIGLMGLRQPLIFDRDQKAAKLPAVDDTLQPDCTPETDGGKYKKSGLRDDEVHRLWEKLTILMAEEKPYTQTGLKLGELASKVRGRPDYVSQVINTMADMNFYEFVNNFRVEEACRLLEADHGKRRNIADIAQDAGFSSINVFNSHFKRLRNTTPSAFRKQLSARESTGEPVG